MPKRFYVETLGCPKNQVDSDKLVGTLLADGMTSTDDRPPRPTWSWSTPVRSSRRPGRSRSTRSWRSPTRASDGARLVVTGCMAERYGDELAAALPEVDRRRRRCRLGVPVDARHASPIGESAPCPTFDLLQPAPPDVDRAVGVRQDRRGLRPHVRVLRHPVVPGPAAQPRPRRHPAPRSTQLGAREIVLVAQDLASLRQGRARRLGAGSIVPLVEAVARRRPWVRLLYLYPSDLTDGLIDAICDTGVPYFDLSLQHVSQAAAAAHASLGRRRPVPRRIDDIRAPRPDAAFRTQLHRRLPGRDRGRPRRAARASSRPPQLDWCGFFAYSREDGTYAAGLDGEVDAGARRGAPGRAARAAGRHHRRAVATRSSARRSRCSSTNPASARSHREAPRSTASSQCRRSLAVGQFATVRSPVRWDPISWPRAASR